jgi:hypothetical protein
MSGRQRVFLHVGLPKTGTTYLQGSLWANQGALRDRGLLLPGRGHRRHLLASIDLREDPNLHNRPGRIGQPWQELADEVNEWHGDALITHEFFGPVSPDQARRAVASFPDRDVHVVVTTRALLDLFISRWQEWVKNGGRKPIDAYPVDRDAHSTGAWGWASFDIGIVLERWGAAVAPEHIHVLPMAAGARDPSELWHRFLSVLGVDPEGLATADTPANTSIGLVEIETLRRINRHLKDFRSPFDRGQWIRGYLGEGEVMPRTSEKCRPGRGTLEEVGRRADHGLRMLGTGGYDVVGDLDVLVAPDVSDRRHPKQVSTEEMLRCSTRTVAAMLADVRSLTPSAEGAPRSRQRSQKPWWRRVSLPRQSS